MALFSIGLKQIEINLSVLPSWSALSKGPKTFIAKVHGGNPLVHPKSFVVQMCIVFVLVTPSCSGLPLAAKPMVSGRGFPRAPEAQVVPSLNASDWCLGFGFEHQAPCGWETRPRTRLQTVRLWAPLVSSLAMP